MFNNSSIAKQAGKRVTFSQVMELPLRLRKEYIKKHSPGMLESQKRAVLH